MAIPRESAIHLDDSDPETVASDDNFHGDRWAARDYTRTSEYYQQALELAHTMGDPSAVAHSLNRVGNWQVNVGRPTEALFYHEEALIRFQALNDRRGLVETFDLVGLASYNSGDLVQGRAYYWRAIHLFRELADQIPDTPAVPGGAGSLRASFMQRALAMLPANRPVTPRQAAKQAFGGLTARERDVAALIGQGRSNRELADTLVVGKRTIETHVGNIFAKLGFSTRAQIVAWAIETGLTRSIHTPQLPTSISQHLALG